MHNSLSHLRIHADADASGGVLPAAIRGRSNRNVNLGLKALATVVFDIDSGQHLDAIYPVTCGLSEDARKSIAHLALPHSNKQDEGDTQFIVRFRETNSSDAFLYGFVLFRQQRDSSRTRGYLQRALVVITTQPFVDLYDRVLRVAGPLFFQVGNSVLEALYESVVKWPPVVHDTPVSLPLAGTFISCVIPALLDYDQIDAAAPTELQSPSPSAHFIADQESSSGSDESDVVDGDDADARSNPHPSSEALGARAASHRHAGAVEDEEQIESQPLPPSPSFGDVLIAKRHSPSTAFETLGLYSSFMGLENCLWQLWQLAITGESLVILSPHARTCSQATLAYTSLIAPLKFAGDYRPYYALYEADFDEIASRHRYGTSTPESVTVIGTTNPFFMKSFKRWPNAIIFPFLEVTEKATNRIGMLQDDGMDADCLSMRIKPHMDLETLEDSDRAVLLRRRSRFVNPDPAVLNQLVSPPEVFITQTASVDEEPYISINNAILRRHFRQLTKQFLRPFDQYFGVWKTSSTNSNLYVSGEDVLKPFDLKSFLASVNPRSLPSQLKRSKWRTLYTLFVQSPHFEPWFAYRRQLCIFQFMKTLRSLRASVPADMLLRTPYGQPLPLDQCEALKREIQATLQADKVRYKHSHDAEDLDSINVSEAHLKAIRNRLRELRM